MNRWPLHLSAVLAMAWSGSAWTTDAVHPEVVELFQSQGCSSCPPADANVMALADRPDLLTLSFGVTYWDQLGWKDTFASPVFTARQWDYAHGLGHSGVFTPQVVVNGRRDGDGIDPAKLRALLGAGDRGAGGPTLVARGGKVIVGAGKAPAGGADVWLARYDPRIVMVPIQRGENAGRTLPHRDVVRALIRLGRWDGSAKAFALPPASPGLLNAVLVQAGRGGPILAATRG
jgi:hypothetical protein